MFTTLAIAIGVGAVLGLAIGFPLGRAFERLNRKWSKGERKSAIGPKDGRDDDRK
jgi:membrane protein DedA with SNARE-associated domain